jgi:hypothetical protein
VTIAGRVIGPLADHCPLDRGAAARVVPGTVIVKRIRPSRDGRFRVTLSGPPRTLAATYRFETRVRRKTTNPKVFPTFTLPRSVEFR